MGREERGRKTSQVVETRTQRDIILDTLRQKFPEWGYDSMVPNWIIDLGVVELIKEQDGEVTGFRLDISRKSRERTISGTKIKYLHPQRRAQIDVSEKTFERIGRVGRVTEGLSLGVRVLSDKGHAILEKITDIRLQDIQGGDYVVLCLAGEVKGRYMEFHMYPDGFMEECLIRTKK